MLNANLISEVGPEELLARYILTKKHIHQPSQTLKANAFVPHPYEELSVTRHLDTTEEDIWKIGTGIASVRQPPRTLYGRGDVLSKTYLDQNLEVVADPIGGNPGHVNVSGWPSANDKHAQLLIAQQLAAAATFVSVP